MRMKMQLRTRWFYYAGACAEKALVLAAILTLILGGLMLFGGCSTPEATLELVTLARMAIADAREAQQLAHARQMDYYIEQAAAIDDAFIADVGLVSAGGITDADGQPAAMTPQWVISAYKGASAMRGIVTENVRVAEADHAVRLDNLAAGDEALDMASQLIVSDWRISQTIEQHVLAGQDKIIEAVGRAD